MHAHVGVTSARNLPTCRALERVWYSCNSTPRSRRWRLVWPAALVPTRTAAMSDASHRSTTHDRRAGLPAAEAETLAPAPREVLLADSATLPSTRATAEAAAVAPAVPGYEVLGELG